MQTLIGITLQDYRRTKKITPQTMAEDLRVEPMELAKIECGHKDSTSEFELRVLTTYPDFITAI
jgi:transcriptional regulator with XRE-family HTH domain